MTLARLLAVPAILALCTPAFADNYCGDRCQAMLAEASTLQAQGKYQEALEKLRATAKAEPLASLPVASEASLTLMLSGMVKPERVQEFRDAARGLAGRALRLAPDDPVAQEVLRKLDDDGPSPLHAANLQAGGLFAEAEKQFMQHRFKEARSTYEAAAQADPQFSQAWVGIGDCAFNEKDWPRAEAGFRRATEIEPRNSQAWRYLADALMMQGKRDAAEGALLSAVAADPSQRPNWTKLSALRAGSGTGKPLTPLALRRGVSVAREADGKFKLLIDAAVKDAPKPDLALRIALGASEANLRAADKDGSRPPFDIEVEAWRTALKAIAEAQAGGGEKLGDPALRQMQALAQDGQLEAAILLLQFRQAYRPALDAWLAAHPDGIKTFVERYALQP
jgi:tetratricopeptide (TPR) repeat protein